ncbi:hypothetical protein [Microvirga rosea]|uniref:hypothetical protein n=1 Tax=Microvirga rosea TaxID=2715425 RepID=UPI001D09AA9E|nr:hypothetical protein [Microvirga rosea]MCB8820446.1 hypothetical protein [Microvirga rosea]
MAKAKAKKHPGDKAKAKSKGKKDSGKKDSGQKLSKALGGFAPLKDMLNSDLGRELLADALIAAAGAAAAALTKTRTAKKAGAATADAGAEAAGLAREAMNTAAGAVAGVVSETARQFLPAALVGETDEDHRAGAKSGTRETKPRYVQRSSDHSKRKTSSGVAKAADKTADKGNKSA